MKGFNLMKNIKPIIVFSVIVLSFFLTYKIASDNFVNKPIINNIKQEVILDGTYIEGGIRLNLCGKYLNNIICVYFNEQWQPNINVEYISDEEVVIDLPSRYYQNVGDDILNIRIEKKINSDKTIFSNTIAVHIIEDNTDFKPVVKSTIPKALNLKNVDNRMLTILGSNFRKDCQVSVNDKIYKVNYINESRLEIPLVYSDWCKEEELLIKIQQQSSKEEHVVFNCVSDDYKIMINGENYSELNYDWIQNNRYIAHGLGEYNGMTVTNSLEAFQESYNKGIRVFEVDILFTNDYELILKHDWSKGWLKDTNFRKEEINNLPKSITEMKAAINSYTVLSFDDLCNLMLDYHDIYIVTDTKDTNSSGNGEIFKYIIQHAKVIDESILNRLIIQIYNEEMYYEIRNIYDFKSIIYTLYQTTDNSAKILDFIQRTGIKVVTMPEYKMEYNFLRDLNNLNVFVYVHTINDEDVAIRLLQNGVYGFYTDRLSTNNDINMEAERKKYFDKMAIRSADSIEDYILKVNDCKDMIMILSVKDDASTNMSMHLQEILSNCGATETLLDSFRSGYILISQNKKLIYEKKSSLEKLEYRGKIGDSEAIIVSGGCDSGNVSNVILDEIEYSPNLRGMNIVVYDTSVNSVFDVISDDLYAGGVITRYDGDRIRQTNTNLEFMLTYLENLSKSRYLLVFCANDDIYLNCTEEIRQKLNNLGLTEEIEIQKSYIGIVDDCNCIYNETSDNKIIFDDFIENVYLHVESAGCNAGCYASIIINNREYSRNTRGLNIVVYDKLRDIVIDTITFDMVNQYTCNYY